jgi:hypothetical protein
MRAMVLFYLLITFLLSSCADCTSCEPFREEPKLKIRFFNLADKTRKVIIIDSVNQIYGQDVRFFQDTTYEYNFPLDMNRDTSVFLMVYREANNLDSFLTNKISVTYSRRFNRRDDNYILVESDIELLETDFAAAELICKDSTGNECISNEAVAKIFN